IVQRVDVPAVLRYLADRVDAPGEQAPERLGVDDAAGVPAPEPDDRDRLVVRARLSCGLRRRVRPGFLDLAELREEELRHGGRGRVVERQGGGQADAQAP